MAVLRTYPDQCRTGAAVARLIDEKALLFWPDTGEPPISHQKVERLVNKWLRTCLLNGKKRQHSR